MMMTLETCKVRNIEDNLNILTERLYEINIVQKVPS